MVVPSVNSADWKEQPNGSRRAAIAETVTACPLMNRSALQPCRRSVLAVCISQAQTTDSPSAFRARMCRKA